jgi:hypothetical protein
MKAWYHTSYQLFKDDPVPWKQLIRYIRLLEVQIEVQIFQKLLTAQNFRHTMYIDN